MILVDLDMAEWQSIVKHGREIAANPLTLCMVGRQMAARLSLLAQDFSRARRVTLQCFAFRCDPVVDAP